ncbi:O-antigen ligase like membrane protein [Paenibacillus tianmuensis]|uniref:O-antigen ligase like membrane protein n=2 Tax=Paenibacillus tianmuensis TaxID=624147 RepID=A0A1G4R5T8_9BACL|nr:O-antigen ligase like membrane protein [Paenibacillus tianmuensis]
MPVMRPLIYFLFFLGLCLLTYDRMPYFSFSVYRPVAMFPLFAASFLLLFEKFRFRQGDIFLIAFFIYSACNSLINSAIHNDPSSSMKHIVTLIVGISIYRVSTYVGGTFRELPDGSNLMIKALSIAFVPGVIAGFLQFIDAFVVRNGFSKALTSYFSEMVYHNRIQMLSGEPSWATIHMLTGGILIYYLYSKRKKWSVLFVALLLLFILTFSAYAYGVILIALFLFILISGKHRFKLLLITGVALCFIFGLVPFLIKTFGISGYYTHRFNLDTLRLDDLMQKDGSFFVRFVFPIIGFIEFWRHPLTGVGGGFYYKEFTDILLTHFGGGLKFKEVLDIAFNHQESATSRNLFSKVFSEEGLIGAVLFFGFLFTVLKKSCTNSYSKFVLAACLSLVMNFDSYAFIDFWLLIGLIRGGFFETQPEPRFWPIRSERFSLAAVSKA